VEICTALTRVCGRTRPEGSVTVPLNAARSICASERAGSDRTTPAKRTTTPIVEPRIHSPSPNARFRVRRMYPPAWSVSTGCKFARDCGSVGNTAGGTAHQSEATFSAWRLHERFQAKAVPQPRRNLENPDHEKTKILGNKRPTLEACIAPLQFAIRRCRESVGPEKITRRAVNRSSRKCERSMKSSPNPQPPPPVTDLARERSEPQFPLLSSFLGIRTL